MLPLTALDIWKKLETPYGTSEEIPALIEELGVSFSTEILNEICWDYIYHQNTLDEVTFATIPYLIAICEKSNDPDFRMETFINIGVILAEINIGGALLFETFEESSLDKETIDTIVSSYRSAFARLNAIGQSLFVSVPAMDEGDKRHFL